MRDVRQVLSLSSSTERVSEPSREAHADAVEKLVFARQRGEAAAALQTTGQRAEALRMAVSAVPPALAALEAFGGADERARSLCEQLSAAAEAVAVLRSEKTTSAPPMLRTSRSCCTCSSASRSIWRRWS